MLTERRKRILHRVYDMYMEQPGALVFLSQDIMASLQLEEDEYTVDVKWLIGEELLEPRAKVTGTPWPLGVKITHKGIKVIESQLAEEEERPEKKPPLGFIKEDEP